MLNREPIYMTSGKNDEVKVFESISLQIAGTIYTFYCVLKPTTHFWRRIYLIYFNICKLKNQPKLADFLH